MLKACNCPVHYEFAKAKNPPFRGQVWSEQGIRNLMFTCTSALLLVDPLRLFFTHNLIMSMRVEATQLRAVGHLLLHTPTCISIHGFHSK